MWPCYGVHITVCVALLVFVLCQPVHSCIEPSLHGVDFFLEIFLWRLLHLHLYCLWSFGLHGLWGWSLCASSLKQSSKSTTVASDVVWYSPKSMQKLTAVSFHCYSSTNSMLTEHIWWSSDMCWSTCSRLIFATFVFINAHSIVMLPYSF